MSRTHTARTQGARSDAAPWRTSFSKRLQVELIARLGYPLLSGWGSTYRFRTEGAENIDRALALGSPIASFWHGRIVPALIYFRGRNVAAMASESFDGEWISRLLSQFGYRTIRGSNSRGARRATLQMLRDVKNTPIALTVDGPRGPNRVAHPGATWLARASGNPVLPFHLEADRYFTLRHWDRSQVPKLGARVVAVIGEPFLIPPESNDDELESYRLRLEDSLQRCEARCHQLLAGLGEQSTSRA
jgi:lysophospholipid acyltransferase (LPLAT)-like uncharacterized protein